MGLQPRKGPSKGDLELSLPSTFQPEDESKQKRSKPALSLKVSSSGLILFGLLYFLISKQYDFPFPGKSAPLPKHVKEGMEQCKIISRPSPHFEPFDVERKVSDRFVKGTKAVLLRNGTIWTGEKDGEEVLEGYDVLLENGIIRKISKSGKGKDLEELKEVEEVELHGAWVTPGMSFLQVMR